MKEVVAAIPGEHRLGGRCCRDWDEEADHAELPFRTDKDG
jgi:hypothetical protein